MESEVGKGSTFRFTFPKGEPVAEQVTTNTFRELWAKVVQRGICGRCGACTAFCSAAKWNALAIGEDGFPYYADESKCLACGICYLICPLTNDLGAEVRRRFKWRLPIGAYQGIFSVRSTREDVREMKADGGAETSLLLYLLDNYLIQGAIVSRRTTAVGRKPIIATSREEILSAASGHPNAWPTGGWPPSARIWPFVEGLYTTYSPTLSAVKALEDAHLSCVALVGTPCQIGTIRKMQCLGVMPAQVIGYAIGSFCMGHLAFDMPSWQKLEDRLGVDLADVDRLDVGEDLNILLGDGSMLRAPLDAVEELVRPTCLACTEFANDYADLSIGGLGSPDGYSTVVIRTDKGLRVYRGALNQGYSEERAFGGPAESRSEKTRILASMVARARRKRERGEARLREIGLDVA